jgi:transposase-like protein
MDRTRCRRFSREFKIEAVQLARQETVLLSQVARNLGVGDTVLRRCHLRPR